VRIRKGSLLKLSIAQLFAHKFSPYPTVPGCAILQLSAVAWAIFSIDFLYTFKWIQ